MKKKLKPRESESRYLALLYSHIHIAIHKSIKKEYVWVFGLIFSCDDL